jgi:Tol biopolymer transport system component
LPTSVCRTSTIGYYDALTEAVVHDLYWSGGFNTSGRYFIAVTNNSSAAVSFSMTVTGDAVTLYPAATATPTPTLEVPVTVTPVPTTTVQGKIVFETATGGEIYTVNGDGSNLTRVSRGIDPSWSPDGTQITFARWDNAAPGVYIANADGSNERIIFTAPRVRWPRWSPDGKYIVFSQDKSKSDDKIIWKLGLVEVATGKLTEPQCSQLCFVPSWDKDSTTVVYTDPNVGIMKTSILGGAASLVLGPSGYYLDSAANVWRPIVHMPPIQDSELSPNGKSIVYSQQAHDRWEVNVVNADGSNQAAVTSPDPILSILFDQVVHNVAPIWSSDSQQILFLSDRNGKWEFFVCNPDGSNVRQVLKNVTDQVSVKFTYENERIMDWTSGTAVAR